MTTVNKTNEYAEKVIAMGTCNSRRDEKNHWCDLSHGSRLHIDIIGKKRLNMVISFFKK